MTLPELSQAVHVANAKWWQDIDTGAPIQRNQRELLSLVISEVSECLEGERKDLMDDKLPHRKMAEVEMADAYIRLLDYAAGFGLAHYLKEYPTGTVPENKGEALFWITEAVVKIASPSVQIWLNTSLARIDGYCAKHGYDLPGAMREKMAYNATRVDHTHEARRIAGGKQF